MEPQPSLQNPSLLVTDHLEMILLLMSWNVQVQRLPLLIVNIMTGTMKIAHLENGQVFDALWTEISKWLDLLFMIPKSICFHSFNFFLKSLYIWYALWFGQINCFSFFFQIHYFIHIAFCLTNVVTFQNTYRWKTFSNWKLWKVLQK